MNEKEERDVLEGSFMLGIISGFAYLGMSQGLKLFEPTIYGLALTLAGALLGYFFLIYGEEVFPSAKESVILNAEKIRKRPIIKPKNLIIKPRPEIKSEESKIKSRPEIKSESLEVKTRPEIKSESLEVKTRPKVKSEFLEVKTRPVVNKEIKQGKKRPEIKKFEDYSATEVKSRLEKKKENRRFKSH